MTITSFAGLRNLHIEHIEIPIIQRDYAQGRSDPATKRIRSALLDALLKALENNGKQPLDFIYGEIKDQKLIPLDGQQRLTTLFLLHWYLAARLGLKTGVNGCCKLPAFTYLTRMSSTDFCRELSDCRRPFAQPLADEIDPNDRLGNWIRDQSWYRRAWERDPTIVGMLVTLDDLHGRIKDKGWAVENLRSAWDRLTDPLNPAIYFDFLSITDIGPADRQYIRMNGRGKSLTEFEHFKARFEKTLAALPTNPDMPTDRDRFAKGVDGNWTDLLWPLRNSGNSNGLNALIDDEFLRLFRYLSALVVWKFKPTYKLKGEPDRVEIETEPDGPEKLYAWAVRLYGKNDKTGERRAFLFNALDALHATFVGKDNSAIEAEFAKWFTDNTQQPGKVAIFKNPNLLVECVTHFAETTQSDRFPLAQQLMFYALLHGWMAERQPDVQRLRVLRNLLLAPDAYLEQQWVADYYLPSVEYLIDTGLPIAGATMPEDLSEAFSKRQLDEEVNKLALKSDKPPLAASLEQLEDHPLLQGCLFAFDLDALSTQRVETFYKIFPPAKACTFANLLTGALLTNGDYGRPLGSGKFQFGSAQDSRWRDVLTGPRSGGGSDPSKIRRPLAKLLNDVATRKGNIDTRLQAIIDDWRKKQQVFDWRYYLIKYECMRSGASGLYYSASVSMGFDLCMLEKDRLSSYYNDPYVTAIIEQSRIDPSIVDSRFYGRQHLQQDDRWLRTNKNDMLRADPAGWIVISPKSKTQQAAFGKVCRTHSLEQQANGKWLLAVPTNTANRDTKDRIELGASLLPDLLKLYP